MSTYTPIATQTLTSAVSSLVFAGIPQNYTDLILVSNAIGGSDLDIYGQLNSDTGNNYAFTSFYGSGSGNAISGQTSNFNLFGAARFQTGGSISTLYINSYSNSTTNKTMLTRINNSSYTMLWSNLWRSNAPVTSITLLVLSSTISAGSTFTLYGIQAGTPKATGGLVTNDGTYYYHTFLQSGIFTPSQALTVDYLVVAGGGGGGGGFRSGAGGAGGLRSTVTATGGGGTLESTLSLNAQNYPITIGAGGSGSLNANGFSGSNSVFGSITATGGGYGGGNWDSGNAGGSGGSGGGGIGSSSTGGAGGARTASPVQGFNGGSGYSGGLQCGGGGGGAGAIGQNGGSGGTDGDGGAGVQITAFATPTNTGVNSGYYAGGGGGGNYGSGNITIGGLGGGGAGGSGDNPYQNGVFGTANTGGGAGGASGNDRRGGNGGSGIVIVRYAI